MSTRDDFLSRERLCGYDPAKLARAVAVVVGCGAAAANTAQTLALSAIGEVRFVDFDHVEPSNLTRSPLFDRRRVLGKRRRMKAVECAHAVIGVSMAKSPVARFAVAKIEELGLAAFEGASVIVACVDSMAVRAYLSDVARLLGIPLVEQGFAGARGQISVWEPSARPSEAPCWRCVHPEVEHGGVGCALHARAAVAAGFAPATQPFAATIANLAAAHALEAVHGRFPLRGRTLYVDVVRGTSCVVEATRDPACPGEHRSLGAARDVAVEPRGTVSELFKALAGLVRDPALRLRSPFIESAPCARCGASVRLDLPAWRVTAPPVCRPSCSDVPRFGSPGIATVTEIAQGDPAAERRLAALGFAARDLIEVSDLVSGGRHVLRLAGSLDDLYTTLTREPRNAAPPRRMETMSAPLAPKET